MITASLEDPKDGPFVLNCNYCMWNTLDVGIKFDKPTGIRNQLDDILNGTKAQSKGRGDEQIKSSSLSRPPISPQDEADKAPDSGTKLTSHSSREKTARFNALNKFYTKQISESTASDATFSNAAVNMAYSSPSSIERIMALYNNKIDSKKRSEQNVTIMREAETLSEGFKASTTSITSFDNEQTYSETTTSTQRDYQYPSSIGNPSASNTSQLLPMPTLLRTKRLKRCMTCKHMLTRPEFKISSARYRVKLIALDYIPFITLKPLPISGGLPPPAPDGGDIILQPGKPVQFVMTLRNPLFEDVQVSLGTPSLTPGKHGHRVTILCPQFEIGKNSDAWDDAINNNPNSSSNKDSSTSLSSSTNGARPAAAGEQIAGKLYDQGRNWASVVIEIVPASILKIKGHELVEDEEVIEIPIRVRLQWRVTEEQLQLGGDQQQESRSKKRREGRDKVLDEGDGGDGGLDDGSRELSYWMVVGVGRVQC